MENFTLFQEVPGGLIKILAKNHQFLGVNNALASLAGDRGQPRTPGGLLAHAGIGEVVLDDLLGAEGAAEDLRRYTFVIVTDRTDLDDQIYKNFVSTGAVTEPQGREVGPQATSGEHLKQLLAPTTATCSR